MWRYLTLVHAVLFMTAWLIDVNDGGVLAIKRIVLVYCGMFFVGMIAYGAERLDERREDDRHPQP